MLVVADGRVKDLLVKMAACVYRTEEVSELQRELRRLLESVGWTREHVEALLAHHRRRRRRRSA